MRLSQPAEPVRYSELRQYPEPARPAPDGSRALSEPARDAEPARPKPVEAVTIRSPPRAPCRSPWLARGRRPPRAPQLALDAGNRSPVPAPAEEQQDPAGDVGDRSEPETYDRLVDAFLNTDSESIRRRIATRLHSSRNSDHPLARFYANRAIERLVDAGEEEALENVMSQIGAE